MTLETVLDVFIDANILLLVACFVWTTALVITPLFGLKTTFKTQLFLLNGSVLAIIFSPIFVYLFSGWTSQNSLNFSDLVVSNYLDGNINVDAALLQSTLDFRALTITEIVSFNSPIVQTIVTLFFLICAGLIIRVASQALQLRKQIQQSYLLKRIGPVDIVINDMIQIPFSTRGIKRRYIVIPEDMLTQQQDLRIAIAHELQHFRQKDVEWEFFLEALKPFFFWNPVFYIWRSQVRQLREYACDQVLINRSPYNIREYCECLLRVSKAHSNSIHARQLQSPTVALVEECVSIKSKRSFLRKRILMMANQSSAKDSALMSMTTSGVIIAIVFLTSVLMQNPKDWSHDRLMLSTIINLERMNNINTFANPSSVVLVDIAR